ncbi:MAG: hypothetical protein HPY50_09015 [Firmicutes bacterium]|nr:hypothetical protein [Bacillota bacterium]
MDTRVLFYVYILNEEHEVDGILAGWEEQTELRFYPQDNYTVVVMELATEWENGLDELLQGIRPLKRGLDELLLGSAIVLISGGSDWDAGLGRAGQLTCRSPVLHLELPGGRLARMDWGWPDGRAYYIYQSRPGGGIHQLDREFLISELPLMDANLAKLDQLTIFYRERRETVSAEKRDLDEKLSKVLYQHFVPSGSDREVLEELEQAVNNLSSAYGMLAGSYRLMREGRYVMQEQIASFIKLTRNHKSVFDKETVGSIIGGYDHEIQKLRQLEDDLQDSTQNFQAGIDVVRSRIDIMMSRKSLELQGRSLVFQVAAGFIEFIIVAYYALSLWKTVAPDPFHDHPGLMFFIAIMFSGEITFVTHLLAEKIQGEKLDRKKTVVSLLLLAVTLLAMVYLSLAK